MFLLSGGFRDVDLIDDMTHRRKNGVPENTRIWNDVVNNFCCWYGCRIKFSFKKKNISLLDMLDPCRFQCVDPLLQQLFDERWTVLVLSQKAHRIQIAQLLCSRFRFCTMDREIANTLWSTNIAMEYPHFH